MRKAWMGIVAALLLAGCGRSQEQERHPYLISEDDAWGVARSTMDAVCGALEDGDVEAYYKRLSLEARYQMGLQALVADRKRKQPAARVDDREIQGIERSFLQLSPREREQTALDALKADYRDRKQDYVRRAKGFKLIRVFPPSVDVPYVDMTMVHVDNRKEFWRLVYEDGTWRISRMGEGILEVEGLKGRRG